MKLVMPRRTIEYFLLGIIAGIIAGIILVALFGVTFSTLELTMLKIKTSIALNRL